MKTCFNNHEAIREYLDATCELKHLGTSYYKWLRERGEYNICTPYKQIKGLEEIVEGFLDSHKIKIKQCFSNTWDLCNFHPDIEYVEGLYCFGIPIPLEHAWCYYNGYYFDLTSELCLQDRKVVIDDIGYFIFNQFDYKRLFELSVSTGYKGLYSAYIFNKEVKNGRNERGNERGNERRNCSGTRGSCKGKKKNS